MNSDAADFLVLLARNSATAGVLMLVVLLLQRVCGRQLSPHWRCALWFVVALRLLPLSVSSPFSIFNLLPGLAAHPPGHHQDVRQRQARLALRLHFRRKFCPAPPPLRMLGRLHRKACQSRRRSSRASPAFRGPSSFS